MIPRIVLIGYGPVGARFVEGMIDPVRAGVAALTVLGAERHDAYNRVLVGEYAVGRATRERLEIAETAAAVDAGAAIRLAETAVAIDRDRRVVRTDAGAEVSYDRLVLATGARANLPTLAGLERCVRDRRTSPSSAAELDAGSAPLPPGVATLRSIEDAERVLPVVRGRGRIIVLGAGVLGMEVALAAAEQGAEVTVVHHGEAPMDRNLDRGAGRSLAQACRRIGVRLLPHSRAESVILSTDTAEPRFDALVTADGKVLPADLLLISVGASARTELAVAAGIEVSAGIVVDESLASWSDPAVFAIGDCAQIAERAAKTIGQRVPGAPAGLIAPGWRQADWLSDRLAIEAAGGVPRTPPPAARPAVVMLKAEGIDVVAGGDVAAEPWDADPEEQPARHVAMWVDGAAGSYVKMVTRGGVLEGFASVGMPRTGAELTLHFERGSELPADPSLLLRLDAADATSTASDPLSPESTVCWCNGVTVQGVTDAAAGGCRGVDDVGRKTRAGTGCGGCRGRIAELIAGHAAAQAPAATP
ncbi:FAD-dependent oxidoreductase [Microbacter sp. GSS18]|nr:FAD-dependent oxidoreductase [Microbacter sp. GSS18]